MKKRVLLVALFGLVIIVSCKKDKKDDTDKPQKDYPFYFTASISGSSIKFQSDEGDTLYGCNYVQSQHVSGSDYDIYEGTVIMDLKDIPDNVINVNILKHFDHSPTSAERTAMIKTGNYNYGVSTMSSSTVDGVSIGFTDADGNFWTTESGSQTGSTFNVSELIDNPSHLSGKIFKATFTCKLYNGIGGSLQVTNATIRGKILAP